MGWERNAVAPDPIFDTSCGRVTGRRGIDRVKKLVHHYC